MKTNEFYSDESFDEFTKMLEEYADKADKDNVLNALEKGAEEFIKDIRSLPKPRSNIAKSGYTHLLDTVTYKKGKDEIETGWGKYYGPMVERGTGKMKGVQHMSPTFARNQKKYYGIMQEALFGR